MYEFTVLTQTAYSGDCGICCPVSAETASFCMPHTSIVFTLLVKILCFHTLKINSEIIHSSIVTAFLFPTGFFLKKHCSLPLYCKFSPLRARNMCLFQRAPGSRTIPLRENIPLYNLILLTYGSIIFWDRQWEYTPT